ncbi:hypothetical protein NPIL_102301 [Nephila pilipes]|uniref:Uncharacterized protein n=1 Tax=Nephila pilipes TaxID=299642 RepID=A0A8X6MU25_NEPPI|nr:hypothetical protein NPIL_102301 [Nephila pilipes]
MEEFFMSVGFETYADGDKIFKTIDKCVRKNDSEWSKRVFDYYINRATAMVGKVKGALSRKKHVTGNATSNHCVIHRYSLATKRLQQNLKLLLDAAVYIITNTPFTIICLNWDNFETSLKN